MNDPQSTHRPDSGPEIEDLLRRLRPRIKKILAHFNIPFEDAEDILQEALIAAFLKWPSIENKEPWFLGTVRNRCMLYWKRRWRRRMEGMDPEDLEALCQPQPPPQERDTMLWDLEVIANAVGERHWAVLFLRYGLGLSNAEIAKRLGYCASSIRKLSCRAVSRLQRRVAMRPELPEPPEPPESDAAPSPKVRAARKG